MGNKQHRFKRTCDAVNAADEQAGVRGGHRPQKRPELLVDEERGTGVTLRRHAPTEVATRPKQVIP